MGNCKSIRTLFNAKSSLLKLLVEDHEEHLHKIKEILYQEVMGSLMYTMVATVLDLAFAISPISQFMSNPSPNALDGG